jgi:hypothetical protein
MQKQAEIPSQSLTTDRLMTHLRAIAALGPRPTTGDAERLAARYVREQLETLGIGDIREQRFKAPDTYGWRAIPTITLALLGGLVGLGGRMGKLAGGLMMLGGALALRETLLTNPVVPVIAEMGTTQNIIARIPASGETKHFLYLIAHLDTNKQRFSFPFVYPPVTRWFTTLGIGAALLGGLSLLFGALTGRKGQSKLERIAMLASAGGLLMAWIDEQQPYVEGANDNASAVATVLALAESFKRQPLSHTEVICLFTGAEESGCEGIQAYLDMHAPPRDFSTFVDFEMVGAGDLCYVTRHGMSAFSDYRPTPQITALAAKTARENPELGIRGKDMTILEEVAPLIRQGYEAICIAGYGDDGMLVNWHRLTDTVENIEADTLLRAAQFGLALAHEVDAKASA